MRTGFARLLACVALTTVLMAPAVIFAAPPDSFPGDTVLYIGWPGRAQLADSFGETAMAKILAEPQLQELRSKLLPAIDKLIQAKMEEGSENSRDPQFYAALKVLLDGVYRHPTAVALISVNARSIIPMVDAGAVVEAGDESAALAKALTDLFENKGMDPSQMKDVKIGKWAMKEWSIMGPGMSLRWGVIDNRFVVAFGNRVLKQLVPGYLASSAPASEEEPAEGSADAASSQPAEPTYKSLAENPAFIKGMSVTGATAGSPVIFVNVKNILKTLDSFQPMLAGFKVPVLGEEGGVKRVLTRLGAENAEALTVACTADAGGLKTTWFFHCPGMQAWAQPLTDADLAVIPKNASWASAGNADLAAIYTGVLEILKSISADVHEQVMDFMGEAEKRLGMSIEKDVLSGFGDTWVVFDEPDNGSVLMTGLTIVADVKPGNKADAAMRAIVRVIGEESGKEEEIAVREETYRGVKLTYMNFNGLPVPIAPAWAEYEGRWVLALFPQMVRVTLDRMMDKGPSILANEGFIHGRKVMPADACSLNYINAERGTRHLYSLVLPLSQALAGMGQGEGLDLDISMLPALPVITKHLFDNVSAAANTPDGYVSVSYGAVPATAAAIGQNTTVMPLMVSILLPSLARARELSKRTVSAANLGGISRSALVYAEQHDGNLPPDLDTLVKEGSISEKTLIAPADPNPGEDGSYVYIGAGVKNTMDPGIIIAYEKPELNEGEGVNVAYLDGHAQFLSTASFDEALEETKQKLKDAGVDPEAKDSNDDSEGKAEKKDADEEKSKADEQLSDEMKENIELVQRQVAKGGPLATVIEVYKGDIGQYPSRIEDLVTVPKDEELAKKWNGPYMRDADMLKDLWGHSLKYLAPGEINEETYDLWSVGPDGKSGTEDDIGNFKKK